MSCSCVTDFRSLSRRIRRKQFVPLTGRMCWDLAKSPINGDITVKRFSGNKGYQLEVMQCDSLHPWLGHLPLECLYLFVEYYESLLPCTNDDNPMFYKGKQILVLACPVGDLISNAYFPLCGGQCKLNPFKAVDKVTDKLQLRRIKWLTEGQRIIKASEAMNVLWKKRLLIVWAKRRGYGYLAYFPMDIIRLIVNLLKVNIDFANI